MNFLNKSKGFTLMEVVLATAIFAVATVAVSDIFVRVNKAQRKTQGIQETASDARFAIESIARTIRLSEIDYDYYGGAVNVLGENILALRSGSDTPIKFSRQNGSVCPENSASVYCLAVCLEESCLTSDWQSLTPRGVDLALLNFLIYPLQSPYKFDSLTGSYKTDTQPRVTIISNTENITAAASDQKSFWVQTTVSTRIYKR